MQIYTCLHICIYSIQKRAFRFSRSAHTKFPYLFSTHSDLPISFLDQSFKCPDDVALYQRISGTRTSPTSPNICLSFTIFPFVHV